jgi:hypothetical protein
MNTDEQYSALMQEQYPNIGKTVYGEVLEQTSRLDTGDGDYLYKAKVQLADGEIMEVDFGVSRPQPGKKFKGRFFERGFLPEIGWVVGIDEFPHETAAAFGNSAANDYPPGLALHARIRKREEEQRRARLNIPHFETKSAFNDVMNVWQLTEPMRVRNETDGIHVTTKEGDAVRIRKDEIIIKANASDATLRALVLHAKHNWNNKLGPNSQGNQEMDIRVWAHAQVHGVKFGWQPSPEIVAKMQPTIDRLRAEEASKPGVSVKLEAPVVAAPAASLSTEEFIAGIAAKAAKNPIKPGPDLMRDFVTPQTKAGVAGAPAKGSTNQPDLERDLLTPAQRAELAKTTAQTRRQPPRVRGPKLSL